MGEVLDETPIVFGEEPVPIDGEVSGAIDRLLDEIRQGDLAEDEERSVLAQYLEAAKLGPVD